MSAETPCPPPTVATIPSVTVRHPVLADASQIHRFIRSEGGLELNSLYCYLLLCRDFGRTSLLAESSGVLSGFVMAYRPPDRHETVFVWQVGVARQARRQGLGRLLLERLLALPACRGVRFLEATVTHSNTASQRLFTAFAEDVGVMCEVGPGFPAELFCVAGSPEESVAMQPHESEDCFRIGPLASPA